MFSSNKDLEGAIVVVLFVLLLVILGYVLGVRISLGDIERVLSDQTIHVFYQGVIHSLTDYQGKWLVVYFYPKDDTPGCTKEACTFRDMSEEFMRRGVSIVGISKDSISSHKKFSEKFHLSFPLLSDPTANIIKAYGAWGKKKFMGKEFDGILRNTYLINPKGEIVKTYEKVDPLLNASQIFTDLKSLQ